MIKVFGLAVLSGKAKSSAIDATCGTFTRMTFWQLSKENLFDWLNSLSVESRAMNVFSFLSCTQQWKIARNTVFHVFTGTLSNHTRMLFVNIGPQISHLQLFFSSTFHCRWCHNYAFWPKLWMILFYWPQECLHISIFNFRESVCRLNVFFFVLGGKQEWQRKMNICLNVKRSSNLKWLFAFWFSRFWLLLCFFAVAGG